MHDGEISEAAPGVAETHSAWVVFLGDHAYKVKKPVRLEFLDFSTRAARERAAHREVELNRRLAPDVYQGVADVVGPDGEVCDHVVVMRRMPAERRLSALVRRGELQEDDLRAIARTVAAFHAGAVTSPAISEVGHPDAVRDKVERDLDELRAFVGELLDTEAVDDVAQRARRYLAGRSRLLESRVAQGLVRDGHGDLLADDIFCLPDWPRILDCLDFDDGLRYGDVLADIGFLAMDLEHLGAPQHARRLLEWYREFTDEHHPDSLAHYYIAFRALIRCKVACVRVGQGAPDARGDARTLLELARRHLRAARIRLVLVGGAPGTGKSTLAAAVAERNGWMVLRSDEVRKDITGVGRAMPARAAYGDGIYDATTSDATYSELLERARRVLEMGESAVVDASWSRADARRAAAATAQATSSDLVELRCEAPADVADSRVERRHAAAHDVSDATADVAAAMRAAFEPWPSSTTIQTSGSPDDSLDAALSALDRS